MKALVVHDTEEVKDVFLGWSAQALLRVVKESRYWPDIRARLIDVERLNGVSWDTELFDRSVEDRFPTEAGDILGQINDECRVDPGLSLDGYSLVDPID